MPGYSNRVIRLTFPELSADAESDLIWVTIRNPRLVPNHELIPKQVTAVGADGMPVDLDKAKMEIYELMSKLIIGSHIYDCTAPVELDAAGNDVSTPVLLQQGHLSAEQCMNIPMEITNKIALEIREAQTPL
jgi:hypothetical protein